MTGLYNDEENDLTYYLRDQIAELQIRLSESETLCEAFRCVLLQSWDNMTSEHVEALLSNLGVSGSYMSTDSWGKLDNETKLLFFDDVTALIRMKDAGTMDA